MKRMNQILSSNRSLWMATAGASALALIVACGGGESRNRTAVRNPSKGGESAAGGGGAAAQSGGVKKIDPATAGTVSGVVKFEGTAPTPEAIDMSGTPDCAKNSTGQAFKEDVVVKDGKVQFAFVYVDIKDAYEVPAEPAMIDQVGCRYVPHVMGIQAGQKIQIKSSDPTLHNVHYLGKENGEDNFGMNKPGVKEKTFLAEDAMLKFKCDVHPWMGAWVGVKNHPFFATSAADGSYTIKNVPAGEYDLVIHHEKLGEQRVKVKVEAGKATTQDFTLKM